jgi:chaperonin cofactor prefoldin
MDETLEHAYDAAKRREYYLKNRHLKGRKHGSGQATHPRVKSRAEIAKERHAHLEAQVSALKARFERLQAALKILVEQAKKRSGVESKTTSKKTTTSTQQKAPAKPQKLTASQKKAKAVAEKKRRDKEAIKNGTATNSQLSDEVKSLNERIKTIKARIEKMQKTGAIGSTQTHKTK